MTRAEVLKQFREEILPGVDKEFPPDSRGRVDGPARREAWNNWVDGLCQDRIITRHQCDTWSNPF